MLLDHELPYLIRVRRTSFKFCSNIISIFRVYCEGHDCPISWILERKYRNVYRELGMIGIREQSIKSDVTRFRMGHNQSPVTA